MNVLHLSLEFELAPTRPKHGGILAGLQRTSLFESQIKPILELLVQQCYSEAYIDIS